MKNSYVVSAADGVRWIETKDGEPVATIETNVPGVALYRAFLESVARSGGEVFDENLGRYVAGSVDQLASGQEGEK